MGGTRDRKEAVGLDTDHRTIEETRKGLAAERRPGGLAAEAEAHRDRVGPSGTPEDDIRREAADRDISAAVASRPT